VLNAAGTSAARVGNDALAKAGVADDGMKALGGGALLAGVVLGATAAFIIDKRYYWAAGYCVAGAALSFVGLSHGQRVAWAAGPGTVLGYLFASLVCLGFSLRSTPAPAELPANHLPAVYGNRPSAAVEF
jgi:AGZA family xanthine/uracil permease-like MFS transporter